MPKRRGYHPVHSILTLAWPVVLEMCLHTLYWICDAAMVMRLGARQASAVEYAASVLFGILGTCGALGIGVNSLVARFVGGEDHRSAGLTAGQALSLSLVITACLTLILGLCGKPFCLWAIKDGPTAALTVEYFNVTLFSGGALWMLILVINGVIRGMGHTRVSMYIALATNIYNVFFDYILIFGKLGFPALGVKGAALATGTAQILGLVLGVIYLYRSRHSLKLTRSSFWPFKKEVLKGIVSISLPAGAEEVAHNFSRLISITWIAALGPISFAANTAAVAVESFSFMPGYAFAVAATTLVGQRLGAGKPQEAVRTGTLATFMATGLMGAIALCFFLFPHYIMKIFSPPEAEVLHLGIACLRIAAVEQPFIAIAYTLAGALKGAGDTKGPLLAGCVACFLVRLPLIYAIVYIFHLGVTYIWWATAIQYLVTSLIMLRLYRRAQWHRLACKPSYAVDA
ncbi:MAG TPA: MATE family efflux transporter [Firmicutes bacterium]|nr:MATE family efflux transporter [Bacillota bacterium]